jgi:ferredoxin-NADP reductase/MOSC domain-containing protein YiiM/ferredoxin
MNSLVSINLGLPTDIKWQGKIVRTAVWKRPVSSRVMARRLNLDGDGQGDLAGHGGEHRAVMVYQLESYKHWETYLGRHDFEYGQFGENLTVDGLPDDEVCIGDRYRIGGAIFEVTQPRVTCYRVGIRMNNPQMPTLLVSHKRPGFYLRVIEEGEIGAGDEILKVADGPERISVAEIDGLLYLPGHPKDRLEMALRIPSLSAGWRDSLKALLVADKTLGNVGLSATSAPPPAWIGFRPLRVAAIHRESLNVLSFVLESEDRSPLPSPLAGQFLAFRLQTNTNSAPILRSYSLSGPQNSGSYRVSVKRGEGTGGQYLHDRIHIGDLLQVSAPRGDFTTPPHDKPDKPIVLLSAGIGATPVLAMLHSLVEARANSSRDIWWCYGARNGKEHPFAAEVRSLLKDLPQGHSIVVYSQPEDADQQGRDYDAKGHLSLSLLEERNVPKIADFYLCGPTGFLKELTSGLESWGVPHSSIHSETFGAGPAITPGIAPAALRTPHPPPEPTGTGPQVSFTRSGLTVPWDSRFASLLEFAEACDVPVRWACRAGVCHTCESGIIGGSVLYSPDPLDRPTEGNVLICCSTPRSEIALDL